MKQARKQLRLNTDIFILQKIICEQRRTVGADMIVKHTIQFDKNSQAQAVQIDGKNDIDIALQSLGIAMPARVLVLVGGASGMGEKSSARLETFFREVVISAAKELNLVLITGGTDAGIMAMLGRAHSVLNCSAQLIGVAAAGTVSWPGRAPLSEDACNLEPNHPAFILVPGQAWGDEARWLAEIASRIADRLPSLTLLVNGGEIALKDVQLSLAQKRAVLALKGSGRKADEFAAALSGDQLSPSIMEAVATQRVALLNLQADARENLKILKSYFSIG